ncbi:MAG: metallophosphoesterase [Labilithrix sp.]
MPAFFPPPHTLLVIAFMAGLVFFALRFAQPKWWRHWKIAALFFAVLLSGVAIWLCGYSWEGCAVAYTGILILFPAALMLPAVARTDRALERRGHTVSRRALLSLPMGAAVTSASGFASASDPPRVREIPMRFPDLHPDLRGLRVLQVSDVHLGAGRTLADLEEALRGVKVDLIALTGDLADDPWLIPAALRLIVEKNARHGAFACLGNHEYHHVESRPFYEESDVPLLVGDGRSVRVGAATLFIGGADDPRHMRGRIDQMLGDTIRAAAAKCGHADFRLLLCHRPEGFGPAAEHGFDLTLAGHTHGGQIGLLGKSLFELIDRTTGWWGAYVRRSRGNGRLARLYTTSGFGHWFHFRIGCPTELPIIVLEGGPPAEDGSSRA